MAQVADVPLLTSAEVAQVTGRARVTIQSLARRRKLGRKVGRDWLFTWDDVHKIQGIDKKGGAGMHAPRPPKPRRGERGRAAYLAQKTPG